MWKICDNLYLAQLPMVLGPTREQNITKHNIKKIITVTGEPIPEKMKLKGVDYSYYELLDQPDQDILENGLLVNATKEIVDTISAGKNVLIHCVAAVSRSVTLCCSYIMITKRINLEQALEHIQSIRSIAQPNRGFIDQLNIFYKKKCSLNIDEYNGTILNIPALLGCTLFKHPITNDGTIMSYKKDLFDKNNVIHDCSNILIQPMSWLDVKQANSTVNHGCAAKLGSFLFHGSTCNQCGLFVSPWIQVDRSRVDEINPKR